MCAYFLLRIQLRSISPVLTFTFQMD